MTILYSAHVEVARARLELADRLGVTNWPEEEEDRRVISLWIPRVASGRAEPENHALVPSPF